MPSTAFAPATIEQPAPSALVLTGCWTARGIGDLAPRLEAVQIAADTEIVADGTRVAAMDTVGAWLLQKLLVRLRAAHGSIRLVGLNPACARLLAAVEHHPAVPAALPAPATPAGPLDPLGRTAAALATDTVALLSFVGETALSLCGSLLHPSRLRWRSILHNIRSAGFDALPIVGLLAFLLGVVVAHQAAAQLRQYGANIFVADLVGLSMLREFAPLITAIIVAGRSGSAYAAQIATMQVTDEIDAMRTLGIAPIEMLVLPKLIALVIALPLLTVFADILGVVGGMIMARPQLGVSYGEFADRFTKAVSVTSYMVGIGKAPVFAIIIGAVGCFHGFRAKGAADSVGRQTTRSVVHSIFLVIVADALFSVAFSALDL